jgi:hypothetical protein
MKTLKMLSPRVKLTHPVIRPQLGGLVSSRDFLAVVGKLEREDGHFVVYTNISDEYQPTQTTGYVRYLLNALLLFFFKNKIK